jgi:hypothetical protein
MIFAQRSGSPAAGAIRLRGWALQLLGTRDGPTERVWEDAARREPRSWDLFLRLERCALAVQTRLDRDGGWDRLPDATTQLIRTLATHELQRVLSARAQVRTVGRLTAEHGWRVLVLKGGAAAAAGELVDLGDLDILVDPGQIGEVTAALDRLGFERQGLDHAAPHHLAARVMPNARHIEVHHTLKGGAGLEAFLDAAIPLEGEPRLLRQGPADHLRYLLLHSTIQHPERTGRIRDLLLIGHALRSASPAEIATVEGELARGELVDREAGAVALAVLRLARELEDRTFQGYDPQHGIALRVYTLFRRRWWFSGSRSGMQILVYASRILARGWHFWRDSYRHLRALRMNTITASPIFARLERRASILADAARQLLRLLTFTAATTYALIAEVEARWVERDERG